MEIDAGGRASGIMGIQRRAYASVVVGVGVAVVAHVSTALSSDTQVCKRQSRRCWHGEMMAGSMGSAVLRAVTALGSAIHVRVSESALRRNAERTIGSTLSAVGKAESGDVI